MPRFVLLYHDCPPHYPRPSHWDFMLEAGDSLRTWALEKLPLAWHAAQSLTAKTDSFCPSVAEGCDVAAEELGAHRRDYLEHEGELSGDRGCVTRVAAGTYATNSETTDSWQLTLVGDEVSGQILLRRSNREKSRWTLTCLSAS